MRSVGIADAVRRPARGHDSPSADRARRSLRRRALTWPPAAAFSALITFSVMSTRGLGEHHFLQDQVVLLGCSKICLMTLLARSTTAGSSSFLRWFRSSWNSRRLRWKSRSCSTSSRWRRLRSASARVGASFSSLSAAALSVARLVVEFLLALAELGLQLGLRRLGRCGLAQHAVAVDVADLQFLGLRSRRGDSASSRGSSQRLDKRASSLERGPDLELESSGFYRWLLATGAVAQLQRAHRRDPAQADAGRGAQAVAGRSSRPRPRRCRRRRSRTCAAYGRCRCPGTGTYSSVLRLSCGCRRCRRRSTSIEPERALLEAAHRAQAAAVEVLEHRVGPAAQALAVAELGVEAERELLGEREVLLVLQVGAQVAQCRRRCAHSRLTRW